MAGMWYGDHADGPHKSLFKDHLLLSCGQCCQKTYSSCQSLQGLPWCRKPPCPRSSHPRDSHIQWMLRQKYKYGHFCLVRDNSDHHSSLELPVTSPKAAQPALQLDPSLCLFLFSFFFPFTGIVPKDPPIQTYCILSYISESASYRTQHVICWVLWS